MTKRTMKLRNILGLKKSNPEVAVEVVKEPRVSSLRSEPRYYADINDIVESANASKTSPQFFSPGAMKFFNCRLTNMTYGKYGHIFITSEKNDMPFSSETFSRKYTVRSINPWTDSIDSLSEFQQFETLRAARRWAVWKAASEGGKDWGPFHIKDLTGQVLFDGRRFETFEAGWDFIYATDPEPNPNSPEWVDGWNDGYFVEEVAQ